MLVIHFKDHQQHVLLSNYDDSRIPLILCYNAGGAVTYKF